MGADAPGVRTIEVRGWLLRAAEDLRAGRHDLTATPPLLNDVAFHAQQCAEKTMKAFLVYRQHAFRRTHNLTELGGAVARLNPQLADLMRNASLLTEFAWRFRYPGDLTIISPADALRAIETAERVHLGVIAALPGNCRPQ